MKIENGWYAIFYMLLSDPIVPKILTREWVLEFMYIVTGERNSEQVAECLDLACEMKLIEKIEPNAYSNCMYKNN